MTQCDVPFADLHAQYQSIKDEIDSAIAEVIKSSAFIRGKFVDAFEHDFARAAGAAHCISCGNGTDALYIAMRALGVTHGDEVITTAHSWISTAETVTQANGKVVFCDTESETFNIDVGQIEAKISPRTVGIVPVHLYGQAANMDAVMEVSRKHKLWVVEDCAQAHLSHYKGKPVGSFGNAGTFSFYPGKNLGAMGDAGAIVTSDTALATRMAMFARHGGLKKGDHQIEGINSRLDGLQAAILSVKLRHLPEWTVRRQNIAAAYDLGLQAASAVITPAAAAGAEHVYHLYVIKHEKRDQLAHYLGAQGIQTAVNYPVALPFLPAYKYLGGEPAQFPNAFRNQSRILSLPIYPEMTVDQQRIVIEALVSFG